MKRTSFFFFLIFFFFSLCFVPPKDASAASSKIGKEKKKPIFLFLVSKLFVVEVDQIETRGRNKNRIKKI